MFENKKMHMFANKLFRHVAPMIAFGFVLATFNVLSGPADVIFKDGFEPFDPVTITAISPGQGPVGKLVTIFGTGFSEELLLNKVEFNGVPATVINATVIQLEVTVPAGATTGPVSVSVGFRSAISDSDFIVLHVPVINSVYPHAALPDSVADNIRVTGENFVAITFEFQPAPEPPDLVVSPISISADGTSAIIDVAVSTSALGEYALVATNEAGSSDTTISPANRFTVLANGDGDADGDGLTDGEEIALRTDPFARDTDGDGWDDPVELDGESDPLDPNSTPFIRAFVSRPPIRIIRLEAGTEPADNTIVVSRPAIQLIRLQVGLEPADNTLVVSRPRIEVSRLETGTEVADNTLVVSRPRIEVTRLENGTEAADNTIVVSRPRIEVTRLENGTETADNTIAATPPSITVELEDLE